MVKVKGSRFKSACSIFSVSRCFSIFFFLLHDSGGGLEARGKYEAIIDYETEKRKTTLLFAIYCVVASIKYLMGNVYLILHIRECVELLIFAWNKLSNFSLHFFLC